MQIVDFRITRFQFPRDRVIGDSQVRADEVHLATIELIGERGETGLGFMQSLFHPLPAEKEIERTFREECWPSIEGQHVEALAHAVRRPRGGNVRRMGLPFEEALQHAIWDLFAKSVRMPLWKLLGARAPRNQRLCERARFPPERRGVRTAVRAGGGAGLPGIQDQGRTSRRSSATCIASPS